MNKSISLFIKFLSILLLVAAIVFPLLTASGTVIWISDPPTGAQTDYEDTIFEIGVLTLITNELTYDETNSEFNLVPTTASNDFTNAISMMQLVAMIAIGIALFFFLVGF